MRDAPPQFRQGVFVVKVGPTGRLLKRTVHLGLKPEYLELTSKKFFDVRFHITDILNVTVRDSATADSVGDRLARLRRVLQKP